MGIPFSHHLLFLFLSFILSSTYGSKWSHLVATLNRSSFPEGFFFGAATSAYQIEGAAFEDGKGASIWDKFTQTDSDKITDHSNGDIAADFYHLYKEDIVMMNKSGMDALRFSISWPRILPKGKISGGVNPLGVQFYNDLINHLLANGLQPYVTLYHWDLPQALEDEYGGFLSPKIVGDYLDYVKFCFDTFGDRVKNWITFNEPYAICIPGYATGAIAPGRCSKYEGNCTCGDSATEPYIVGHNLILSHATCVKLYREKYQASQKGQIGIVLHFTWFEPFFENGANQDATRREMDFTIGWFLHPLTYGDYPENMRSIVGTRLPKFTESESQMIKKSYDFLGVNYYTSFYAANVVCFDHLKLSASTDSHAIYTGWKNGIPIGQPTGYDWQFSCPKGIRSVLIYIKENYDDPVIVITENGYPQPNNKTITAEEAKRDELRINYHHSHLVYILKAIEDGVKVRGYLLWSFLDDFEWNYGYSVCYGIVYVDFTNGLKRYPKDSYFWFSEFLNAKNMIFTPSASKDTISGALSS